MGAPKGHPKYGGRAKGTPNKESLPCLQKAEELGIDPFEVLLLFASGDWKKLGYKDEIMIKEYEKYTQWEYTINPAVRAKAAGEACQYLYPKRKAIEHGIKPGEDGIGFKIVVEDYTVKK